jgi:hypothetical protein
MYHVASSLQFPDKNVILFVRFEVITRMKTVLGHFTVHWAVSSDDGGSKHF